MAIFAVVIVSLYGSNLVNFFYMANDDRVDLPEPSDVRVHPAFIDLISPETFGVYTDRTNARLSTTNMVPNGVYYDNQTPIVSRTVGDGIRNSTTKLRSLGGYYTVYEVIFLQVFEAIVGNETLKNIMIDISRELDLYQFNKKKLLDFDDTSGQESVMQVDIQHVWGSFLILAIGYVTSILYRVFFTEKTGLTNITLFKHTKHGSTSGRGNDVPRCEGSNTASVNTELPITVVTMPSLSESIYENALSDMSEIDLTARTY